MVYSQANTVYMEEYLLSTGQVMKSLGISRVTLYSWIGLGKIKGRRRKIGDRTFLEFDQKEVDRVKGLLVLKRQHGKSLLKE